MLVSTWVLTVPKVSILPWNAGSNLAGLLRHANVSLTGTCFPSFVGASRADLL